uniref:Uncharacterized protein n=1 Tax=Anopheles funestus TaxID=62324 RepID=A0A182RY96_ANOFN
MWRSVRYWFLLFIYSCVPAAHPSISDSTEGTIFGCITTVDFQNSSALVSSECQQSFEIFLPAQANIVRFLKQFEDDLQAQAQQILKAAFVQMLRNDESDLELGQGLGVTASSSRIPDSIPTDLRHEILQNMLADQRFRTSPVLRARLHSFRNLLLSQRNYAAAFWIDRLLKRPDAHQHAVWDKNDAD